MNYIQQAYKSEFAFWKYLIIPIGFFGLMVLNYLAIKFLNIDVDTLIKNEIEKKGENRVLIETLAPLSAGLILLLLWVKYIHKQSIRSLTTSRKKIDWSRIWFAFILWGMVSSGFIFIDYYLSPEDYVYNFKLVPFITLSVIAILLIPLQTSFEEYLFRGYLMQGLGIVTKSKFIPLITTSVIFGILHIANPEIEKLGYVLLVYYIGTGLFVGVITLMDEGLELALGFHAANNLFTALLVTADWTAFQTNSVFKDISDPETAGFLEIFMPVFIVFPILVLIFAKKYKWINWKDKLFGKVSTPTEEEMLTEKVVYDSKI